MSEAKKRVPKRRFKEFLNAGDWEQRKFLDLLDTQNGIRRGPFGSSLKKDSFVKKSDYVVYEQQNAIYDNYETRYFISKEKYNELIRFNIQPGDFIMSGAGTIGRISMVPDGIKKGVFNQALIRFKVNKDSINPLYFLKFMQSDMMQKQLTQANPGSAMTNLVPMDELKKWDVTIPSLEEQNKISTFINQIDDNISLYQRKLDKLQATKKALLQEMFPKEGQDKPKRRFKGFTDAWEQRKLDELTMFIGDGLHGTPKYDENGSYYFINGNNLVDNKVSVTEETKKVAFEALGNDDRRLDSTAILMSINGTIGTLARYNNENIMLGKSVAYITPKNINRDFLFYQLQGNVIQSYFYKNLTGTTIKNLGLGTIKNTIVMSTLSEEESTIGRFFYKLDQYITLHQRKLDKLTNLKQAYLNEMFV